MAGQCQASWPEPGRGVAVPPREGPARSSGRGEEGGAFRTAGGGFCGDRQGTRNARRREKKGRGTQEKRESAEHGRRGPETRERVRQGATGDR